MAAKHLVPADLEPTIDRLVESGAYADADEVLRAAVLLLEVQERELIEASDELWTAIEEGQADARAGRTVPAEEVFAHLRATIATRAKRDAAE